MLIFLKLIAEVILIYSEIKLDQNKTIKDLMLNSNPTPFIIKCENKNCLKELIKLKQMKVFNYLSPISNKVEPHRLIKIKSYYFNV